MKKLPGLISLADWKDAARSADPPPSDAVVRKQYVPTSVKAGEGGDRSLSFIISTQSTDRDNDRVMVEGWDFAAWLKNPVVLWAHQYDGLPVGKGESIISRASAVRALTQFVTREVYPFADTVYQLLLGGFLRACSVGFRVLEWTYDEERRGFDILRQELLEFSIVPVPANAEALMDAKSAGIDVAPLKAWCEQTLDGLEGPGLWVPKSQAQAAFKALAAPAVVIDPTAVVLAAVAPGAEKAGRTFSAANEARIRGAHGSCQKAIDHLQECLEQMDPAEPAEDEPDEDDGKGAAAPAVKEAPVPDPGLVVTVDSIRAATRSALDAAVGEHVRRALGRID